MSCQRTLFLFCLTFSLTSCTSLLEGGTTIGKSVVSSPCGVLRADPLPALPASGVGEETPPLRLMVELPASEDPDSLDRKGAEALATALQQTRQFEVATSDSPFPSAVARRSHSVSPSGRVIVMTASQNKAMDATRGGVETYSADDAAVAIVTKALLKCGYKVVEKVVLNAVLREKAFQRSGIVDQKTAVRIGKLAGAKAIVIANVYNTNTEQHEGFEGGSGNPLVDIAGKMVDPSGPVKTVEMTIKMIDVETGEIVWADDKTEQSRPGASTSHTELLRRLVKSLSFGTNEPVVTATATPPPPPPPSSRCRNTTYDAKIEDAQAMLKKRGYYNGSVDGCPGPKTMAAIRKFQRDHDLSPTGEIDPPTEAALREPKNQSGTTAEPPTPEIEGEIDGRMRPSVRAALKKFQKDLGLPQTGEADAATKKALGLEP